MSLSLKARCALLTMVFTAVSTVAAQSDTSALNGVRRELAGMALAWNASDIAGHVAPYADSATMMTARGLVWAETRSRQFSAAAFWSTANCYRRFDSRTSRFEGLASGISPAIPC